MPAAASALTFDITSSRCSLQQEPSSLTRPPRQHVPAAALAASHPCARSLLGRAQSPTLAWRWRCGAPASRGGGGRILRRCPTAARRSTDAVRPCASASISARRATPGPWSSRRAADCARSPSLDLSGTAAWRPSACSPRSARQCAGAAGSRENTRRGQVQAQRGS